MDINTADELPEDGDDRESPVDALPDELLLLVLSLVPQDDLVGAVRSVCRRWRRLAQDASLWRLQDAVYELRTSATSGFCRTLRIAPELRGVVFRNSIIPEEVVDVMIQGCALVRRLSFEVAPRLSAVTMATVVQHYSARLEELHLKLDYGGEGAEVLRAVGALRTLRVLSLGGDLRVQDADLQPVVHGCPALQEVHVEALDESWGPRLIHAVALDKGEQLKSITLPKRRMVVSNIVLAQILSTCSALESLSADYDAVLVIGDLPNLRVLRLWYTYCPVDADVLVSVRRGRAAATLAHVRHLTLELDDEVEMPAAVLGACSSALRSLSLVGDRLPRQLSHLLRLAPPSLTHLRLSGPPCPDLGHLLHLLPHLAVLEVDGKPVTPLYRTITTCPTSTAVNSLVPGGKS